MAVGKGKRCLGIQLDDVYGLERGCTTGIVDVLLYLTGRGGKGIIFVDRIFFNTFDQANVRNRCMWQNFLGSSSVLDVVQLTFKEKHLRKQYDCNYFS